MATVGFAERPRCFCPSLAVVGFLAFIRDRPLAPQGGLRNTLNIKNLFGVERETSRADGLSDTREDSPNTQEVRRISREKPPEKFD